MSGSRRALVLALAGVPLVALVVLGAWLLLGSEPESRAALPEQAAATPEAPAADLEPIDAPSELAFGDRREVEPPGTIEGTTERVESAPVAAGGFGWAGAVLVSVDGPAPAGLAIGTVDGIELTKTTDEGFFIEPSDLAGPGTVIQVIEPGYEWRSKLTLGPPAVRDASLRFEPGQVLFAARSIEVRVKTVGLYGEALPGASVTLRVSDELYAQMSRVFEGLLPWRARSRTDSNGHASFRAPAFDEAEITARRESYIGTEQEASQLQHDGTIQVQLRPLVLEPPVRLLQGQVLLADGGSGEGAELRIGTFATAAGEGGFFELPIPTQNLIYEPWDSAGGALVVMLEGYAPSVHSINALDLDGFLSVLLEPAASIEGHLVRAATGEACAGWRMKLADGQIYAQDSQQPFAAEDLADGHLVPRVTGVAGGFRFGGLDPARTYRLRAWNPETFEILTTAPIRPQPGLHRLEVPSDWTWQLVSGRVTDTDGKAVEGCRVRLTMAEHQVEGGVWMQTRDTVHTDAAGRFELFDVPRNELFLRFNAPGLPSQRLDLDPDSQVLGLWIELGGE